MQPNAQIKCFKELILFADGTNMFLTGKDPDDLVRKMSQEMINVVDWLKLNKLSLNLSKTHFVLFRRKRNMVRLNEELIIDNVKINKVDNTKFLGVYLDECLTFQKHIGYIKGKVSRGIGVLCKCKSVLNENYLRILYNTILYPYFTYCVEVWGSTYSTYLDPLIKAQKWAIRIIAGAKRYDHTAPLYERLKLLDVRKIYLYFIQLFMYKYKFHLLPAFFDNLFVVNSAIHNHETRQKNQLHPPRIITMPFSRTVRVAGVHSYNYFSTKIDMDVTYGVYKKHIKKHLLELNDTSVIWQIL